IGKDISLPADASSVGGGESTGGGTSDWSATTVLAPAVCMGDVDQGGLTAPAPKIAPSIRFGTSARRMRPATDARMTEKASGDTGGVWSATMYFALTAEPLCAGFPTAVLIPH